MRRRSGVPAPAAAGGGGGDDGRIDRAIAEILRALQDEPGDPRLLLRLGDLYCRKGRVDDAATIYVERTSTSAWA